MVPRKGYDVLLAALAELKDLRWRLTIAGDRTRDPAAAARLDADIAALGLADRVTAAGAVSGERLAALYAGADLFVLPSRFEGYGMAFAEAMAHGVPVIGTTAGALPQTIPPGTGILVPPDDVPALAARVATPDTGSRRAATACHGRPRGGAASADMAGIRQAVRCRDRSRRMSGFPASWLALRERYDAGARNKTVLDAVAAFAAARSAIAVADLASGTGATLRALSPSLPPHQTWRLVDNDLGLLARAGAARHSPRIHVTTIPIDLARDLELALDGQVDLVTASALLDLVSEAWMERLVVEIAARKLPVYAALSYDGAVSFDGADPLDERVIAGVNAHQTRDKGFGPALGPAAATQAIRRFEFVGYRIIQGRSDWSLGRDDGEMQNELAVGWAAAAREAGTISIDEAARWLALRRNAIAAGKSSVRVGHLDFFAAPIGTR